MPGVDDIQPTLGVEDIQPTLRVEDILNSSRDNVEQKPQSAS